MLTLVLNLNRQQRKKLKLRMKRKKALNSVAAIILLLASFCDLGVQGVLSAVVSISLFSSSLFFIKRSFSQ